MANTTEYIQNYGRFSFTEKPFGDVDSFAMCQSFYFPVENVYRNLDPEDLTLRELYFKCFEARGSKHKAVGMILFKQISMRAVQMARSRRYGEIRVLDFTERFSVEPAVQFAAMTLQLDDGTLAILYRGTDDSIIGWKEDVDLLVKKGMPSQKLALDYLNDVAAKYEGDILLMGHSKGGNLALYVSLACDDAVRARIRTVYNLEGPGFHNYHWFSTPAYASILDRYRHIVPHNSLIGMMLAHDDDFTVIRSSALTGPFQHDITSWLVYDDHPIYQSELSLLGKFNAAAMKRVTEMLPEQYFPSIEKAATLLVRGMGQLYLADFAKHLGSSVKGTVNAWKEMDPALKTDVKESFKDAPKAFAEAAKDLRSEIAPAPAEADA